MIGNKLRDIENKLVIISEKREEEEQYRGRGLRVQTTMNKINKLWGYIIQYREYASLVAQTVKHLSAMQEIWVQSLGWKDPLENEMATHSSTFAWKIL